MLSSTLSRLPYERNKKFHPGIRASLRIIYRASYQQPLNLKTLTLQAILLFSRMYSEKATKNQVKNES